MLDTKGRKYVQPVINAIADMFLKLGLKADAATFIALVIGLAASFTLYFGYNILAVVLLWLSGLMDAVDGTIARKTKSTSFGTLIDIVFDRIVEISIIIVSALKYHSCRLSMVILLSSIILSMTVFLTVGALSEKHSEKSFYYQPGLAERTEGFIFFSLMMLMQKHISIIAILFALTIFYTAAQRVIEAKKIL
jgi:archaetidylinositol phosphate synthase